MTPPLIESAPHEASGNLIFTSHGLAPFIALDQRMTDDGEVSASFDLNDEQWDVTLYSQRSGLAPPDDPDFIIENIREFRIGFAVRDDIGERSGTFHIAPRWLGMETTEGKPVSTPNIEGVNVRFDGSNIELDTYSSLLCSSVAALGLDSRHYEEMHEFSNVFAFERYVRVARKSACSVIGRGGVLERIFEHVAGRGSFRELREDDGEVEGYHHRVVIDSAGSRALCAAHSLGKRIKHYHPEHPRSDEDDALCHPKIGVALRTGLTDGGAVSWADRDALDRELDETLLNVLHWSGLPVRTDGDVFVPDVYFRAIETDREREIIDDPLPRIRREQGALLVSEVTANPDLTESDVDVLRAMTDGGRKVDALAESSGWSRRTVYRVCRRLESVLLDGGTVRFASEFIKSTVVGALANARELVEQDNGIDDTDDSAFSRWCARYGVTVEERGRTPRLTVRAAMSRLRSSSAPFLSVVLAEGLAAWKDSGRDKRRFQNALVTCRRLDSLRDAEILVRSAFR